MRIVIAEDEGPIRMDLREILIDCGYEVVGEAHTGTEALELIVELKPDAAFLDISMPGLDGLQVAERLAKENAICPLIMLTAFSDADFIARATEAGVYGYVVKPFNDTDIIPAIEIAVKRFNAEQELRRETHTLAEQLAARKLIDRAKGILMKNGDDEAQAYERIRRTAMDKRLTLAAVAEAIILSNELI